MLNASHQKSNDLSVLQRSWQSDRREEVLRMILAIALEPETAAWCAGCSTGAPVNRWPSTLYRLLARTALQSESVWQRCAFVLDQTLGTVLEDYAHRSPVELAELFLEGRESLAGDELAALLWCLIRRRSAPYDLVAERLGLELQVIAARRLHESC
jgi:hypothetical protein